MIFSQLMQSQKMSHSLVFLCKNLDFSFITKAESRCTLCHLEVGKVWFAKITWLFSGLCHEEGVHLSSKPYHPKYKKLLTAFTVIKCFCTALASHNARQLVRQFWSWIASKLIVTVREGMPSSAW